MRQPASQPAAGRNSPCERSAISKYNQTHFGATDLTLPRAIVRFQGDVVNCQTALACRCVTREWWETEGDERERPRETERRGELA